MKKYDLKKILKYLLIFTILCILLFYANSLTVNASSVPSSCVFYDNYGSSLSYQLTIVGSDDQGNPAYWTTENSFGLTAGSYGGLVVCSLDMPVLKDNVYTLSATFDLNDAIATLSSKSILGLGATDIQARSNYLNNTGINIKSSNANNSVLSYVFIPNVDANYIAIPFTSTTTTSTTPYLRNLTISYQGATNQLTSNDIQDIIDKSNQDLTNSIDNALSNKCSNLLSFKNATYSNSGITVIVEDGVLKVTGTATSTSLIDIPLNIDITDTSKLYFKSFSKTGNYSNIQTSLRDTSGNLIGLYSSSLNAASGNISKSAHYFRLQINSGLVADSTFTPMVSLNQNDAVCVYGSTTSKLEDTNKNLNDLKDDINNSNSSGATSDADNFFKDFTTDTFGLTSIITAPLNLISSLTSKTCSNLVLPLPYVNKNLTLPCLSTIYQQFFSDFLTIYQTITFGIVAYWVCIRIFNLVKDFKNPDHDEIEVMDL